MMGVHLEQITVRDNIGATYLVDPMPARGVLREPDGCHQIARNVVDGDRLAGHAHPARSRHRRKLLNQIADHLERGRPTADDDRSPELDDLHAGRREHSADLVTTCQVFGKVLGVGAEPAEEHDATHSGVGGGTREDLGGAAVPLGVVGARSKGMDEVERRIHSRQVTPQRLSDRTRRLLRRPCSARRHPRACAGIWRRRERGTPRSRAA